MARRRKPEVFPAPLREFAEAEWPPVPGECLRGYACRGDGYGSECAPRPGEPCGQRHYEHLAREYPGRPELLAAASRADAFERFHEARLSWLGRGNPGYLTEFIEGCKIRSRIRNAPYREARLSRQGSDPLPEG